MVQIYIPASIRDRLKQHAVALGKSMTDLVMPDLNCLLNRLDKLEQDGRLTKKNGGKKTKS